MLLSKTWYISIYNFLQKVLIVLRVFILPLHKRIHVTWYLFVKVLKTVLKILNSIFITFYFTLNLTPFFGDKNTEKILRIVFNLLKIFLFRTYATGKHYLYYVLLLPSTLFSYNWFTFNLYSCVYILLSILLLRRLLFSYHWSFHG